MSLCRCRTNPVCIETLNRRKVFLTTLGVRCRRPQRNSRCTRNLMFFHQTLHQIGCIVHALNRVIRKVFFIVFEHRPRQSCAGRQTRPSRARQVRCLVLCIGRRWICIPRLRCRPQISKDNLSLCCRIF